MSNQPIKLATEGNSITREKQDLTTAKRRDVAFNTIKLA